MEIPAQISDIEGTPVVPGDTIAAAFRDSTRAYLRIGKVLSFGERGNKLTVKVHWHLESGYGHGSRTIDVVGAIEAELRRFVRLAD